MGDATLKKLASELKEKLRNSKTVDRQSRNHVRASMRNHIRRLLRKYNYRRRDKRPRLLLCSNRRRHWRMTGRRGAE